MFYEVAEKRLHFILPTWSWVYWSNTVNGYGENYVSDS